MATPRIAVFSGPTSTIANSPTLVTRNKGRKSGDRILPGRFDHLIAQLLYEPVKIKIKNARREGVRVAAAIKNLKEARVLLNKREFSEAKTKADDALKAVKSTVKGARPDLVIKAKTKETIKRMRKQKKEL